MLLSQQLERIKGIIRQQTARWHRRQKKSSGNVGNFPEVTVRDCNYLLQLDLAT